MRRPCVFPCVIGQETKETVFGPVHDSVKKQMLVCLMFISCSLFGFRLILMSLSGFEDGFVSCDGQTKIHSLESKESSRRRSEPADVATPTRSPFCFLRDEGEECFLRFQASRCADCPQQTQHNTTQQTERKKQLSQTSEKSRANNKLQWKSDTRLPSIQHVKRDRNTGLCLQLPESK